MDNTRLFLFASLAFVGMLLWQQWQADYGPKPVDSEQGQPQSLSQNNAAGGIEMDDLPEQAENRVSTGNSSDVPGLENSDQPESKLITVETDVILAKIDTLGGVLRSVKLKKFPVSLDQPDELLEIVHSHHNSVYLLQSGLRNKTDTAPTHYSLYQVDKAEYQLESGSDALIVPLVWQENGITVTKSYHFQRGDYLIDVKHTVDNQTDQPWLGAQYRQIQRSRPLE